MKYNATKQEIQSWLSGVSIGLLRPSKVPVKFRAFYDQVQDNYHERGAQTWAIAIRNALNGVK